MRYGRALLAGLGWAGTLGGVALCVLIFLSAYLAFDGDLPGVEPRRDEIVRLPPVPEAEVPRVPLARPPSRSAAGGGGGGGAQVDSGRRTPAGGGSPRSRGPQPTVPMQTPQAGSPPPSTTPPPLVPTRPQPASPGGRGAGPQPTPQPTLGDTTSDVVGVVGTEVGRVSPPVGEVIRRTGETAGDAVDALDPLPPPG